MFVSRTLCISSERGFLCFFNLISAYVSVLDIYFIRRHTLAKTLQCDRALYQRRVTCLELISNVFSVHQRTCLISHTSAYVCKAYVRFTQQISYAYVKVFYTLAQTYADV